MLALCVNTACSSDDSDEPTDPDTPLEQPVDPTRPRVNIVSRAEEGSSTETAPLQAGLFMVNYQDNRPDELLPTDNYVNNQLMTWANEAWSTSTPIYWNDMDTQADFYAYAPYMANVDDARQLPVSVSTDQRTDEAFAQSDFLWGTVQGQTPTTEGFSLLLSHQFSRLTVVVTAEAGFSDGELQASDVSVTIGGTRTSATADLQTGILSISDDATANDVRCHPNGDLSYTAILLPQQVPFSNLIQVDWQGNKYTLQNSFKLESRRQYTLTVKLKKTKSGFDIGIEGWDILPEDFGGTIGG